MPTDTIIVLTGVIALFAVFALTLAWAHHDWLVHVGKTQSATGNPGAGSNDHGYKKAA